MTTTVPIHPQGAGGRGAFSSWATRLVAELQPPAHTHAFQGRPASLASMVSGCRAWRFSGCTSRACVAHAAELVNWNCRGGKTLHH